MHKSTDKENALYFNTHIAAAWVLFSIAYWFAAFHKPVHVDEFYSWVYAERCSFAGILSLADHGIGHPPLYHVLQKMAAILLPHSFPISLRIVNYIAGSIFIILFVRLLLLQRHLPVFCYGAACSAIILNAFLFSRMYGLVLLFSLLFYWFGEKYYERANLKNAALLLSVFTLGMYADYNFFTCSIISFETISFVVFFLIIICFSKGCGPICPGSVAPYNAMHLIPKLADKCISPESMPIKKPAFSTL